MTFDTYRRMRVYVLSWAVPSYSIEENIFKNGYNHCIIDTGSHKTKYHWTDDSCSFQNDFNR